MLRAARTRLAEVCQLVGQLPQRDAVDLGDRAVRRRADPANDSVDLAGGGREGGGGERWREAAAFDAARTHAQRARSRVGLWKASARPRLARTWARCLSTVV
jgi:hypothetical protein